ncbi:hypothetical protein PInf_018502 [Phytophthora infestans]|nr:hypothetical protein PInf_018502 [Phytophthora infestans]
MQKKSATRQPSADPAEPAETETRPVEPVVFTKRNCTDADTLALAQAWHEVHKEGRRKDEKTALYNSRIYKAFKAGGGTSTKRSIKAVEDKFQALREMYRFISDVNANRIVGRTGKPGLSCLRRRSGNYDTKLDEVRSMLEERSKAFLVQTEKLQREEMRERREQHNETMQLMKALISTLAKTNN